MFDFTAGTNLGRNSRKYFLRSSLTFFEDTPKISTLFGIKADIYEWSKKFWRFVSSSLTNHGLTVNLHRFLGNFFTFNLTVIY